MEHDVDGTGHLNEGGRVEPDMRDRVMWLFAVVAGVLLVLAVVTVAVLAIFQPEADTTELAKAVSTQISLIVGAVLGYAARGPDRTPEQ